MANEFETWFTTEAAPLLNGKVMHLDVWDEDIETVAAAWHVLNFLEKKIKARLASLRERLFEDAEQDGVHTEKKGYRLDLAETEILRERREDKIPDDVKLKAYLEELKIPVLSAFTEQKTYVVDPSKLTSLIFLGKLDKDRVEAMKGESWALKCNPKRNYTTIMDAWDEKESSEKEDPIVETKPRAKRTKSGGARKKSGK